LDFGVLFFSPPRHQDTKFHKRKAGDFHQPPIVSAVIFLDLRNVMEEVATADCRLPTADRQLPTANCRLLLKFPHSLKECQYILHRSIILYIMSRGDDISTVFAQDIRDSFHLIFDLCWCAVWQEFLHADTAEED